MAWVNKPFTVDSKRLAPDAGRVLRSNGGRASVNDGPYSETKEILGGYYTIEAPDYDQFLSARFGRVVAIGSMALCARQLLRGKSTAYGGLARPHVVLRAQQELGHTGWH